MRFIYIFLWLSIQGFSAYVMTWGVPAVSLDSNPAAPDSDVQPSIAIDSLGNAVVVWGRSANREAFEDIWVTVYNQASRVWSGPNKISSGNATNGRVALDALGNSVVVWEEGFPTQIMFRTLSASGVWEPPLNQPALSVQPSTGAQTYPQIAVNRSGNAVAIWVEQSGGKKRIHSAKKLSGYSWKNLGVISDAGQDAKMHLLSPLAINGSGDGFAIWQEGDQVVAAQYVNQSWKKSVQIAPGSQPSVAVDASGNAFFVWSNDRQIQAKTAIDGVLSDLLTISNPSFLARHPSIGVDEAGNAVVIFEQYDLEKKHKFIAAATLPSQSVGWSSPVNISGPSPADVDRAGFPRLVVNGTGDCAVIWKEQEQDQKLVVQGAGYSKGTWSSIRTLSSPNGNVGAPTPAYDLGIALNDFGNIIAVWPEDPKGDHTQHIKAILGVGLAVTGTLPPIIEPSTASLGVGMAEQVLHRFPAHADLFNILKWVSTGDVAYYKIYRGGLSFQIGTSTAPYFEDHQRSFGKKETYLISAVDRHGHESSPITIIGYPKKKK